MVENMNIIQDKIPRNSIFMMLLIISLIAAFFVDGAVVHMLTFIFNIEFSPDFMIQLNENNLWSVASYWSAFSLIVFISAFLIPAIYNVFNLVKLKNKLSTMPRAKDKAAPVTKDIFLNSMMGFKFIYNEFVVPYCDFLYEGEEDPKQNKAKHIKANKKNGAKQIIINAMVPAGQIFKIDELLKTRLSFWFIKPLPLIILAAGILTLILSIVSMLQVGGDEIFNEKSRQILSIGYLSFSACLAVAIFMVATYKILMGYLNHRGAEIVKMIDALFHYKPVTDAQNIDLTSIEVILRKTASSFKDLSAAIGQKQEEAVNELIIKTMESYVIKIGSSIELQSKLLQKTLDDTAGQIGSFSNAVAVKLDKMSVNEERTYDQFSGKIEKLITSLNGEVKNISALSLAKGGILDDLNKTAGDLKSVSGASDDMIKKFDDMAVGLAHLLAEVEKMAPMSNDRREKLALELAQIRENNKTVGMGRKNGTNQKTKT